MRYFRATPEVYEAVRLELDALYGHPFFSDPDTPELATTETCIVPAESAPRDAFGRCLIGVSDVDAARPEVASKIESLTTAGLVEEISQEDFQPV